MNKFLYHSFRYTNYVVIIGILLAYLSIYISPQYFRILGLFGLAYPVFLIGNLFFVIFWIYRRNNFFAISLIAIGIGSNHFSNTFQLNPFNSPNDEQTTFKVLSYNVRLFDKWNWTNDKNTAINLFDFIIQEEANIVCFQEFYENNSNPINGYSSFQEKLNLPYKHIELVKTKQKKFNYGIATYSNFPIIRRQKLSFKDELSTCIFTDLKIKNDTIRVYNNHLASIHLGYKDYEFIENFDIEKPHKIEKILIITQKILNAFYKRSKQVSTIAKHIENSPYPVIVCGDFNDTPVSYAYTQMRNQLKDGFVEAGNGIGITYAGSALLPIRIDYILHSTELNAFHFQNPKINDSDHYPITCSFSLASQEK